MTDSYVVIWEPDGDKMPTPFYKRLHGLGLFVRGDEKNLSPVARRQIKRATKNVSEDRSAIIIQECSIVTASYSLAHDVAGLAQEFGAKLVMVGVLDSLDPYEATRDDERILAYTNQFFGRIGRPPADEADPVDWVITCYEEGKSYTATAKKVINCPNCSGLRIAGRPGVPYEFRPMFPHEDVGVYWVRTRFASQYFEVPGESLTNEPPGFGDIKIAVPKEQLVVDLIAANISHLLVPGIDTHDQLYLLDALFSARTYAPQEVQIHARATELVRLFTKHPEINASTIPMAIQPDRIDLLDIGPVAPRVGAEYFVANLNGIAKAVQKERVSLVS